MSLSARLMVGEPKRATSLSARQTVLKARGGAPSSRSIFTIRDCSSMTTGGCTWYTASVPALAKHLWPVRAPRDGGGRHLLSRQRTAPRRHGTAEKRRLQLVPLHGQVICIQTAPRGDLYMLSMTSIITGALFMAFRSPKATPVSTNSHYDKGKNVLKNLILALSRKR